MSARKSRPKPGRLQARELTDDNAAISSFLSPNLSLPPSPDPSPSPQPATTDVFEIEDFSMATGWERLIRQVEERMVEWRVDHGKMGRRKTGVDDSREERKRNEEQQEEAVTDNEMRCELHYSSKTYSLTCRLAATATDSNAAYLPTAPSKPFSPASLPPLSLYLGLPSYLILAPFPPRRVSRNESALLLSTLTLAASAVACPVAAVGAVRCAAAAPVPGPDGGRARLAVPRPQQRDCGRASAMAERTGGVVGGAAAEAEGPSERVRSHCIVDVVGWYTV